MRRPHTFLIWSALLLIVAAPVALAATSPLLQWRQPIYIIGGLAGVVGLILLLAQPLLAARALPGLGPARSRHLHRVTGLMLVLSVVVHVAGLWITSPPDVIDALTFTSATPFSAWGVIAMWALFVTATFATLRGRLRLSPKGFRLGHKTLAVIIATCTILHIIPIDGTMEPVSKSVLMIALAAATAMALRKA